MPVRSLKGSVAETAYPASWSVRQNKAFILTLFKSPCWLAELHHRSQGGLTEKAVLSSMPFCLPSTARPPQLSHCCYIFGVWTLSHLWVLVIHNHSAAGFKGDSWSFKVIFSLFLEVHTTLESKRRSNGSFTYCALEPVNAFQQGFHPVGS